MTNNHAESAVDDRVQRELCDVEQGGVIAEPGVGRLKLKEILVHVLV